LDITHSCPAQPQYVAPNTFPSIFLDMAPSVPHSILIHATTIAGADIPGAHVRLYRASSGFDEVKIAGLRCGQAFWNGLAEGTADGSNPYSLDISAPPYASTTTVPSVDISGYSIVTVTVN
jgi:hypothetical protein